MDILALQISSHHLRKQLLMLQLTAVRAAAAPWPCLLANHSNQRLLFRTSDEANRSSHKPLQPSEATPAAASPSLCPPAASLYMAISHFAVDEPSEPKVDGTVHCLVVDLFLIHPHLVYKFVHTDVETLRRTWEHVLSAVRTAGGAGAPQRVEVDFRGHILVKMSESARLGRHLAGGVYLALHTSSSHASTGTDIA